MNIHLLYDNNYSQWFIESVEAFFPKNQDRFIVYNPSGTMDKKPLYVSHYRCESLPILEKGQLRLDEQIPLKGVKNLIIHFYDEGLGQHIREIPAHIIVKWVVWGADMYVPISNYLDGQLDLFSLKYYKSLDISLFFNQRLRITLSQIKEWYGLHSSYYKKKKHQKRVLDVERVDEIYTYLDGDYNQIIENYGIKKKIQYYCFAYQYVGKQISIDTKNCVTSNMIQVGHNATPFNNQFSIISKLSAFDTNFDIIIPLSYGDKKFAQKLKYNAQSFKNLKPNYLDTLLPYAEYQKLMDNVKIHIFNNRRQEAMGNILQCVANGKKVYLSEKNTGFEFLKKIGCLIFSVETDLTLPNSLSQDLNSEEKCNNRERVAEFFSKENYIIRLQKLLS